MVRSACRAAIVLILTAIFAGCASTGQRAPRGDAGQDAAATETPAETISAGMTKSEVRRLWGEPRDISPRQGEPEIEIWTYEFKKAMAGAQSSAGARAVVQRTIYRLTFTGETLESIDESAF
ncbi:MAG TPA: hypothetical protein VM118_05250 [Acidobacteriota bacterium]|nr:hypothetical protein [Acidobacteriota bacterium]